MRSHKKQRQLISISLKAAGFLLLPLLAQPSTLQEQLKVTIESFSTGDYATAYWQFEGIELDYGSEPEFLNRNFQRTILPARAYAALMADRPTDALIYFSSLLKNYPTDSSLKAFVLYNAAIAQSQTGATAKAAQTFETFRMSFPGSPEAGLALLQQADLLAEIGDIAESETLLDDFYHSQAPVSLRMQGRLRALQLAKETGNTSRVQAILFGTNWKVSRMPDIAVLSFAALDIGDLLLEKSQPEAALKAYQLALPRDYLLEKHRENLAIARQTQKRQSLFASAIWKSHWQQLIRRLENQLQNMEAMPDYTPGLYLRKGQAYLLAARHREASILFRTIAQNETFKTEIRAEAHYRWILSTSEAKEWEEARRIARNFLLEYPKHKLAQSALFLIARSFQSEGQYTQAIEVLDDLITHFPKDKQASRWYFTRGYNFCALENQPEARSNFEAALEKYPKSILAEQIELWKALTFFFERNYSEALDGLLFLQRKSKTHSLYPEILYRTANTYYAQRDYRSALKTIDHLIKKHPDHYRIPEAQALRGDIYMGLGELTLAANAFRQVSDENLQIYDYAVFQAAKVYKALERYKLQRKHLQAYVNREDANERPRTSEALYWIGWTFQQQNRDKEAYPIFEDALKRFGNDPKARSVNSILSAYYDLYKRNRKNNFDFWLQRKSEESLQKGELTWFSRLTLFTVNQQRRTIDENAAEATLLSIHRLVPIDQQDPESLEAIGIALVKRGYQSANDYFEYILNEYPDLQVKASAYYGKAKLALKNDWLNQAQHWLSRFLKETPTHPLAADTRLLAADIFTKQDRHEDAINSLNEILKIKEMRGRPYARALSKLAQIELELKHPKRAIAYWQRVYTLYQAYPEIIAPAYWESSRIFEQLGDFVAARNTLKEMLGDNRLMDYENYALAEAKLAQLEVSAENQNKIESTQTEDRKVTQ